MAPQRTSPEAAAVGEEREDREAGQGGVAAEVAMMETAG